MKITLSTLYPPKQLTFDNVKKFSIVIVRRSSQIVDIDVEVDDAKHFGLERIMIEEERAGVERGTEG